MTVAPEEAPERAEHIEIEYKGGDPVAVNGRALSPAELLSELNRLAGAHGIGRVDVVENRYVGMKSRGVYETPGGTVLHQAHRALEALTLDREVQHLKEALMPRYAELVYYGYWFSPERQALQAFVDHTQGNVEGQVRLKLYKGSVQVLGRRSAKSLYRAELATFEREEVFDPRDAQGFIKLNALRLRLKGYEP